VKQIPRRQHALTCKSLQYDFTYIDNNFKTAMSNGSSFDIGKVEGYLEWYHTVHGLETKLTLLQISALEFM